MAVDEALMESVRGGGTPALRFYRWSPACLSLGRNQPAAGRYDEAAIAGRGWEVVRRPTGGRAVLHDRELTYAVVMPERGMGTARGAYAAINRALVEGLRRLGVPAELQPRTGQRAAIPSLAPCFRDPAEGEVVVGGRKLVGSAQVRERGVLLQHGSLLLGGSQAGVAEVLREPEAQEPGEEPVVLEQLLHPLPEWEALVAALSEGWADVTGTAPGTAPLEPGERSRAAELAPRYADLAWTFRR